MHHPQKVLLCKRYQVGTVILQERPLHQSSLLMGSYLSAPLRARSQALPRRSLPIYRRSRARQFHNVVVCSIIHCPES